MHHYPILWRLLMSCSNRSSGAISCPNANSVLCNQQTGDNVSGQFVIGTAPHSHECTMMAGQRDTSKRADSELYMLVKQHVFMRICYFKHLAHCIPFGINMSIIKEAGKQKVMERHVCPTAPKNTETRSWLWKSRSPESTEPFQVTLLVMQGLALARLGQIPLQTSHTIKPKTERAALSNLPVWLFLLFTRHILCDSPFYFYSPAQPNPYGWPTLGLPAEHKWNRTDIPLFAVVNWLIQDKMSITAVCYDNKSVGAYSVRANMLYCGYGLKTKVNKELFAFESVLQG